jgi:hypothetical protein
MSWVDRVITAIWTATVLYLRGEGGHDHRPPLVGLLAPWRRLILSMTSTPR